MIKIILSIIILFSAEAVSKEKLVLYVVHYPPYMIVDAKEAISGMDVDVVQASFKAVGKDVSFKVLP